ncbi:MFS transporter [Streptomyces sp. NPDC005181]|uniref:MFS transporter n=1 Tax=Streptomyces sp. NPDC005181 TaxID=3156869 RepID=UPI00339DB2FD
MAAESRSTNDRRSWRPWRVRSGWTPRSGWDGLAAPTIRTELGASGAGLQLFVAGRTISYAVLLITGARLGGLFGRGRAHLVGPAVFTAALLACGLAADTGQLIAFRLIQGAGTAVMVPQVLSLIQRHLTGAARIRALGAYSAVLVTGAAAGQVVGGVLRIPGIARAAVRILLVMAINAGFLFAMTLHVQGGLGHSALRAGLMFGPTAVVFGAVGMTWRRWPAGLQKVLVPGGFVLAAVASVAFGLVMRDGGEADSGCMRLWWSWAQAMFFLNHLDTPGAHGSADALRVCALALLVAAIAGTSAGLVRRRQPVDSQQG